MIVRRFEEGDAEAVAALWRVVFPDEAPRNAPEAIFRRKRATQPELFWVAIAGARLVGTVMAGYDGHRGWIYHLAVGPEMRRRGIATALMATAEATLRALGCPKINLQVQGDNAAVTAFYETLGYVAEPRISMGKRLE